jgi:HK97 gp10 family phage protein
MTSVKVDIDLSGLDRLIDNVTRAEDEIPHQAALSTKKDAKRLVPVDTGMLRDSIEEGQVAHGVWMLIAAMPYAAYVEYGTSRMAAQPYMNPALEMVDWDGIIAAVLYA